MKNKTLEILDDYRNGVLDKYKTAERLYLLFDFKGCLNPYIISDNPIGRWCAGCKYNDSCLILNKE